MSRRCVSSLLPRLCRACQSRSFSATQHRALIRRPTHVPQKLVPTEVANEEGPVERRIESLGGRENIQKYYKSVQSYENELILSADEYAKSFGRQQTSVAGREPTPPSQPITVYGRVTSKRSGGKKLAFLDLATGGQSVSDSESAQLTINYAVLHEHNPEITANSVGELAKKVQRGDWIAGRGIPFIDDAGRKSIRVVQLPHFLAPALQPIPLEITDEEFLMRNRHVHQIVHPSARDVIFLRHRLLSQLRSFLTSSNFVEVTTPLLQANAGGAVARPFETVATEFSKLKLNLRVAPELYLKRLIVGGMQKVFEIGPAFRNEGVDATHNPEFTICEFYGVMMKLQDLMTLTEQLFESLTHAAAQARTDGLSSLEAIDFNFYQAPFKRLEFIPTLEEAIRQTLPNWKFPNVERDDGADQLMATFRDLSLLLPTNPTVPRLLDALAVQYLEPQCQQPTFITHHPECMAPLAKSFTQAYPSDSDEKHSVSARAELFIRGREYVNCYEEENSPIEQRRKFEEQIKHKGEVNGPETHGTIDENYLGTLEWGMPPTGGWGCGFDRIVMLFAGKERIADVFPFGNLRNVVALGNASVNNVEASAQGYKQQAHNGQKGEETYEEEGQDGHQDEEVGADKVKVAKEKSKLLLDKFMAGELSMENNTGDKFRKPESRRSGRRIPPMSQLSRRELERLDKAADESTLGLAKDKTTPNRVLSFKELLSSDDAKS